jgi:hypothetical protein
LLDRGRAGCRHRDAVVAFVPEPVMANTAQSTLEVTPRHLWLALIGGAAVARRGLASGLCSASSRAQQLGTTVRAGGDDARDIAWGLLLTAQEKFAKKPQRRVARRRTR